MGRAVIAIALEFILAVVIALLLLGAYQSLISGSVPDGFAEGARLLFFFMDVGLVVWLVLLVIGAIRQRGIGWGPGGAILAAVVGTVVNLVVVIVVGMVQQGWAPLFIIFAIAGGIAFLIGAIIAALVVHRIVKPGAAVTAHP